MVLTLIIMKRILVIGSGGAGKSTFARRLGRILQMDVIHLDLFFWNPGWVETTKVDWTNKVEELLRRDSWIMDGNYSGTLDIRLHACDTVIFLDVARTVCLWRVLKRVALYRKGTRPDMAPGCDERLDLEFLRWIWEYPKRSRPKVVELLNEKSQDKTVIWLRRQSEIERFLGEIDAQHEENRRRRVRCVQS
jgi:adenylate kinase family enzyme